MKTIYAKGAVKIMDNCKAYVLVYEKEFSQGSAVNFDVLDELKTTKKYEDEYQKLNEKILAVDSDSDKENQTDEYSIWYNNNVNYSYNELFNVSEVIANFQDYVESVRVIEFDVDFDGFCVEDIKYAYVSKDNKKAIVSDRKKELIIETEDSEFRFKY